MARDRHFFSLFSSLTVGLILSVITEVAESCEAPHAIAHGSVSVSSEHQHADIGPGTVVTYICDTGYELVGQSSKTCQHNSTWLPDGVPFCGKFFSLFVPLPIKNAIYFLNNLYPSS